MRVSSILFVFIVETSVKAAKTATRASSFAGSTTAAIFPPVGADTAANSLFPNPSVVGYAGPTITGDEAAVLQTAPAAPFVDSVFPLVEPQPLEAAPTASFDILTHLGSLSPFRSLPPTTFGVINASAVVPDDCTLTQVHLLHRHGARYPTIGANEVAAAVHAAATSEEGFEATGPLKFLNTWTYKLGAEILTPFGRSQMFNLGMGFRVKYGELLKEATELPVFRTLSEGFNKFPLSY
ncbi:3-phytase A [Mycena indigotica]|uniref:3-phytase A n=1 Tax=Mycena indigotica TaxID=2126181 RepID=A0A8H6SRU0_9AGAR|nr:3-phytase A [Mycena indigotica]KAF7304058.1 3-phytase A [Mycena indigotica]